MHIKKILILAFSLCFFYQPLIADTESQISLKILYEKCADKTFKNQYGNQYIDYLKKPVKIMKGQYGPYIKYKSLNATIPEEKDPTEITMEEALILIEKRKEYDKAKKSKKSKKK